MTGRHAVALICQKLKQWDKLHDEQIKASLTVQQLKAVLYELETLSNQVNPSDLQQFEHLVRPASQATLEQVRSFTGYTGGKALQRRAEQDKVPVAKDMELQEISKPPAREAEVALTYFDKPVIL
ncbi:hypothetical protein HPB50_011770 [Hyalomma asiaticum]|uniref:Uncharacterized protein n=1 Tax=Hyalomma asiaticum TaxID=266040 RepID=A0ACB7TL91_HYAAI|nr:hypothetical protein HPB50_011770 [Hyalomma asiaticum]